MGLASSRWALLAVCSTPALLAAQRDSAPTHQDRPTARSHLDSTSIATQAAVPTLTELLGGQSPSLTVYRPNGLPGIGGFLRTRGVHSFVLSADPILEVDGLVVPLSLTRFEAPLPGYPPRVKAGGESLLDAIDPEDIESIEIVPGLASGLESAAGAVNGVIRITTRRGRPGRTRWRWSSEVGLTTDPADYGTAFWGFDPTQPNQSCDLRRDLAGACHISQVLARRPADDPAISLLTTGLRRKTGLLASGATGRVRYAVSGRFVSEAGVLDLPESERAWLRQRLGVTTLPNDRTMPSRLTSLDARANVDIDLARTFRIHLNSALGRRSPRLPLSGDFGASWIYESMLLPTAVPGVDSLPFGGPWPHAAQRFDYATDRQITEARTSARLDWQPISSIKAWAVGGIERVTVRDLVSVVDLFPTTVGSDTFLRQQHDTTRIREPTTQFSLGTSWTKRLGQVTLATTGIGQFRRRAPSLDFALRTRLGPGDYGTSGGTGFGGRTLGFLVKQDAAIGDRLSAFATVRRDQVRIRGQNTGSATSVGLGAAVVISPTAAPLVARLRANLASVGRNFSADGGVLGSILSAGTLPPERVREVEGGADLSLRNGRAALALTWFKQRLSDGLGGVPGQPLFIRAAATRIRATGLEAEITARPIDRNGLRLTVAMNGTVRSDRVDALGAPLVDSYGSCALPGAAPYSVCGQPPGEVRDLDGNGVITENELPTPLPTVALAPTLPTSLASVHTALELPGLGGSWEFRGQVDYAGGYRSIDYLQVLRCDARICAAVTTKDGPPQEQARGFSGTYRSFTADASFLRLRELVIAYRSRWRVFGSNGLVLSLTGRNLATVTRFPGPDPEVRVIGGSMPADAFQPPIPRSITLRIGVDW